MNLVPCVAAFAAVLASSAIVQTSIADAAPAPSTKPVIILVHGAFADATGWQRVIPLLEKDGYTVVAVQNSLFSVTDDITTTRRVIDAQKGPVVVVGHSYGGAVITGAAVDAPNVKALVYLAAFAPDAGEPIGAFQKQYPAALGDAIVPDAGGFGYIDRAKFHSVFCADVPDGEARVMAATQKPVALASFGATLPGAAWKTIPSWYLVSQEDEAINPDLERFYARRMGAHTSEIKASHCAFISHPQVAVDVIEQAVEATTR